MTQPPEENPDPLAKRPEQGGEPTAPLGPDFLSKPVSPSGDQAPADPPPPPPTSPYTSGPYPSDPQAGYQQPGYPQPYAAPQPGYPPYGGYPVPGMAGYPFARPHGGANTAMGLGITSIVCAVATFFCCLTIIGTLAGPFAIVLALRARSEMRANPGAYNNEGAATTGLVTGIIGTVIGLAAAALTIFVFGFFVVGSSSGY